MICKSVAGLSAHTRNKHPDPINPGKTVGRSTDYTPELGDEICARITNGESLRKICSDENMPATQTIFCWIRAHETFHDQYAQARDEQADTYADEITQIADDANSKDSAAVNKARLQVDARKWVAAKLKPRKYGDRVDVDIKSDGQPMISIVGVVPPAMRRLNKSVTPLIEHEGDK